ncbi:CRISPR system Cascade subunit CasE [Paucibacter oligotrophus]|uniref:CRISPR system Cascade subunit CasE n=1 Tax=Roseateles oligotrophus TaxID=1769250 RepID=A0A840L7X4_9BURK|nr:type I-E CRISPR-associated protein Cas6/Cse3/CasE [Roseateles oligotrophus]MBB4842873.1 CRISPR system Cascade subunit CasE [Roseateles oligotrophus]
MFLTQLRLDPRSAQARRDLADPYDMHRTLVRAFVQDERAAPPRFLWRLEPGRAWDQPVLLLQSAAAGDWAYLDALPGYLLNGEAPSTKTFEPDALLQAGARYRFRLAANPTVTRLGKRHGLVGEEDQLAWLQRQAQRLGFAVDAALVSGSDTLRGHKAGQRVSLLRVLYEGVLTVNDAPVLAQAMAAGIGPGKAFGCGLLSLARCP